MRLTKTFALVAALAASAGASAFEWQGISPETRIGGRMVSPGYLRGKVVLVDCRDYSDPAGAEAIKGLQSIWAAYKTKPFILLGSHRGKGDPKRAKALIDRLGVTYPVYNGAYLDGMEPPPEPGAAPVLYVMDSTAGVRIYTGHDPRAASGVVGNAIMAVRMPSSSKQWKRLLDYELVNLPGTAYLRLRDFNKSDAVESMKKFHPEDMKRYMEAWKELSHNEEVRELAKLVELAHLVKDRDVSSDVAKKIRPDHLDRVEAKFGHLKKSENPNVVQEAKNALGDISFARATLKKR